MGMGHSVSLPQLRRDISPLPLQQPQPQTQPQQMPGSSSGRGRGVGYDYPGQVEFERVVVNVHPDALGKVNWSNAGKPRQNPATKRRMNSMDHIYHQELKQKGPPKRASSERRGLSTKNVQSLPQLSP